MQQRIKKIVASFLSFALLFSHFSSLTVAAANEVVVTSEEINLVLRIAQTADWEGLQIPGNLVVGGGEYRLQARVLDGGTVGSARFVSQIDGNNWAWIGNTSMSTTAWTSIDETFTARADGIDHIRLAGNAAGTFFVDDVIVTRVSDGYIVYENDFEGGDTSFGGDGGTFANVFDPLLVSDDTDGDETPPATPVATFLYWAMGNVDTDSGAIITSADAGSVVATNADASVTVSGLTADWAGVDFNGFEFWAGDTIVVYTDVPVSLRGLPGHDWLFNAPNASYVAGVGYRATHRFAAAPANIPSLRINQDQVATADLHNAFTITSLRVYREEAAAPPPPPVATEIPFIDLPILSEAEEVAYLGDYVLMVTRNDSPQWEGFGLRNRAALTHFLSDDGRYAIEMDTFTPRSANGQGIMVQTHGGWSHLLITPNYNPDPSVQPLGWTRFNCGFNWSDLGQGAMPVSGINATLNGLGVDDTMLQVVSRGGGVGGVYYNSSSVTFFDNIRIRDLDTNEYVFNWTFENGQIPQFLTAHSTVEIEVVPRNYAHETGVIFEPRYWDLTLPSIMDAFSDRIPQIGNIWATGVPAMDYVNTEAFFLRNFNQITAENEHKPDVVLGGQPRTTNAANFARGVEIARWAYRNDITMIAHALVWHAQTPWWMTRTAPGAAADLVTREVAKENMRWHAETWAGYLEQAEGVDIHAWDVVNEAFVSYISIAQWNANPDWRHHLRRVGDTGGEMVAVAGDAQWYGAFANNNEGLSGSDYIFYAFKFARRYAPSSILYYNDYNEERPGRAMAIAQMVLEVNERWRNHPDYDGRLLIEAIGMQSHHHVIGWRTAFHYIPWAIELFYNVTGHVSLTELDITLGANGTRALTNAEYNNWTVADLIREIPSTANQVGHHPHDWSMSELQAYYWGRVMGYYLASADMISRLTFWGTNDGGSWRASGRPTKFDSQFSPKLAFDVFMAAEAIPGMRLPNVTVTEGMEDVMPPRQRPGLTPEPPVLSPEDILLAEAVAHILEILRANTAQNRFEITAGASPAEILAALRTVLADELPEGVIIYRLEEQPDTVFGMTYVTNLELEIRVNPYQIFTIPIIHFLRTAPGLDLDDDSYQGGTKRPPNGNGDDSGRLPQTGSTEQSFMVVIAGLGLMTVGVVVTNKKKKE